MSGATLRHNQIVAICTRGFSRLSADDLAALYFVDVKVRAADDKILYYPDLVDCLRQAAHAELIIDQPSSLFEVTSPSTRATDRREKRDAYCAMPSLRGLPHCRTALPRCTVVRPIWERLVRV